MDEYDLIENDILDIPEIKSSYTVEQLDNILALDRLGMESVSERNLIKGLGFEDVEILGIKDISATARTKDIGNHSVFQDFMESLTSIFARVIVDNKKRKVIIKGIDYVKLKRRLSLLYQDKNMFKIFSPKYDWLDNLFFNARLIDRNTMVMKALVSHAFFAMELIKLFQELFYASGLRCYEKIANQLAKKTWVNKLATTPYYETDTSILDNLFNFKLDDYQLTFVKIYDYLKKRCGLDGLVLSFDQGLGKTFTAVGLAEVLKKDKIYVIVPNTLKSNWYLELKKYYKKYNDDEELLNKEVCIVDPKGPSTPIKDAKFIICNYDNIKLLNTMLDKGKNNMIIVDESHYFRNLDGVGTSNLLVLKDKLESKDVLMMSGTPIKARPNEIIPALLMIDPQFDIDAAKIYRYCFELNDTFAANIVKERFGYIIYRKTKEEVLQLPERNEYPLRLQVKNYKPYLMEVAEQDILVRFNEIYIEKLKDIPELKNDFARITRKYSKATFIKTEMYLRYIDKVTDPKKRVGYTHELTLKEFEEFAESYVLPFITNDSEKKLYKELVKKYINIRQSAMGLAIGEILPKRRAQLYCDIFTENLPVFKEKIESAVKKVVIFTTMLDVVDAVTNGLKELNIGYVVITGATPIPERIKRIERFKEDDSIQVIVATSQTMGVGVTLTEADTMIILGQPWRRTDKDQSIDRIHRRGQTSNVTIWSVFLDTVDKNISNRMEEINNWSQKMFGSIIESTDDNKMSNEDASVLTELDILTSISF